VNVYQIWCNLKPGVRDHEFVTELTRYLEKLREGGHIEGFRVLRAKLGLKPKELREFCIMLEFRDLTQLDAAFGHVASRADPIESLHHAVNSRVQDSMFALYRDFPDPVRQYGEEKF
jgi:hypothetical protein